MSLVSLTVTDFRNLAAVSFAPAAGISVLVGPNGQGKTSILEAIGLLALGKSFRGATDAQLVRAEASLYRVQGELAAGTELELAYQRTPAEKRVRVDGQKIGLGHLPGRLPCVIFQPSDLLLLTGEPALRRRYLDTVLSQVSPEYLQAALHYARALRQRNALLTLIAAGRSKPAELAYWNERLAGFAEVLQAYRAAYLQHIVRVLPEHLAAIAGYAVPLTATLTGFTPAADRLGYLAELERTQPRDLRYGSTSYGPHRQDLSLTIDGEPLASYASRGELRSVLVALRLAELDFLRASLEAEPILLLDDVFSELDEARRARLLTAIASTQTVITTTDLAHLGHSTHALQICQLKSGQIVC